jgi:phosphoglucosamine mutase
MANLGLERLLKSLGLKLERTVVGDRYVVEHMRRHGFNVGGEPSGHIVLSDYSTTGDGLIAALQVLAMLAETGKRASEACHVFDAVPQVLTNVRYKNGVSPEDAPVKAAIEQARERLGKEARLVIRKSGTEPVIRVMAEGDDQRLLQSVVGDIVAALEQAAR